jgi:hypothetical protein
MKEYLILALWAMLMDRATRVTAYADATTSIHDAILHDGNSTHQTAEEHGAIQQKLFGLIN